DGARERWQQEGSQPPLYYLLAAALTFWTDASDWRTFAETNPYAVQGDPSAFGNRNVYLHTAREDFPWRGTALAVHVLRLVSLLFGAGSIVVTYRIAQSLFPTRAFVAIGAAAIHAFIPQFLFISAAVNNDALAALTCGLVVWQAVRVAQGARARRDDVLLGALVGLAALTKLSGASMALVAAFAVVLRERDARRMMRRGIVVAIVAVAIAGWWYARNVWLYGDITGLNRMLAIVGTRNPAPDLRQLLDESEGLRLSFWGLFGWFSILMPPSVYVFFDVVAVIASIGLCITLIRGRQTANSRQPPSFIPHPSSFFLPPSAFILVFVGVMRWGMLTPGLQGRLLFPALSAIAVMLSAGLSVWLPARFASLPVAVVASAMFLIALLAPSQVIAPAYARPSIVNASSAPPLVRFGEFIELQKADAPVTTVRAGDALPLTFVWRTSQRLTTDYTLYVKLFGDGDELIAATDTYPGFGMLQTTQWPPTRAIVDDYRLRVSPTAHAPTLATLVVGFYERTSGAALLPFNADGQRIVRPVVARVKVVPAVAPAFAPTYPLDANFGDAITLRGYDLTATGITLYWQARQPIADDYTVFVHALDASGNIIAQADAPPRNGAFPTSAWDDTLIVADEHALAWPAQTTRIAVGLYLPPNGAPLPVVGSSARAVVIPMAR
ncbi:MAG: glycosyltransferase family 39 protein, partial [Chloroflexota bacterium]